LVQGFQLSLPTHQEHQAVHPCVLPLIVLTLKTSVWIYLKLFPLLFEAESYQFYTVASIPLPYPRLEIRRRKHKE